MSSSSGYTQLSIAAAMPSSAQPGSSGSAVGRKYENCTRWKSSCATVPNRLPKLRVGLGSSALETATKAPSRADAAGNATPK